MNPGVIILVLAVLGFVGIAIWAIVNYKKPFFPKGKRYTFTMPTTKHKAHVIFGPEVRMPENPKKVVRACARAAKSVDEAWPPEVRKGDITEIVVLFETNFNYTNNEYGERFDKNAAAYLGHCGQRIGPGLPMPVIKSSLIDEVVRTGEPVIHELCHEMAGQNHAKRNPEEEHNEKEIWVQSGGPGSQTAQGRARKLYVAML